MDDGVVDDADGVDCGDAGAVVGDNRPAGAADHRQLAATTRWGH